MILQNDLLTTSIDWAIVESQLVACGEFYCAGKKLRFKLLFIYVDTSQSSTRTAKRGSSSTTRHSFGRIYNLICCPAPPCIRDLIAGVTLLVSVGFTGVRFEWLFFPFFFFFFWQVSLRTRPTSRASSYAQDAHTKTGWFWALKFEVWTQWWVDYPSRSRRRDHCLINKFEVFEKMRLIGL